MTTQPGPGGVWMADTAACENRIQGVTPARSAFSMAARTAPVSRSEPIIIQDGFRFCLEALCLIFSKIFGSYSGQFSKLKERFIPGGIFTAIKAASIGITPDPQKGSNNGEFVSQPAAKMMAAARVSRNGAFATAWR